VAALADRVSGCVSGRSARGKAIVIPVKVTSYPAPAFSEATLLLAMKAVYVRTAPSGRRCRNSPNDKPD
jgi:hypothetical protein